MQRPSALVVTSIACVAFGGIDVRRAARIGAKLAGRAVFAVGARRGFVGARGSIGTWSP